MAREIRTEAMVVDVLCAFLAKEGYRVRTEVPNMGQSMDVGATRNRWFTAIEAKLRDWRSAFGQCRAHELVADFICVAVGTKSVSPLLLQEATSKGYGVIHVNLATGQCSWAERPQRNERVWSAQRRRLSANLRGIEHV
ncbi:hypothetical protein LCGC14_1963540 [marine sediment metagenome]|uniref:Restriction endonuclease type IV Mrr domain-containing protein n=1 Tax=marine sediment metagenome TaxID=412755 RepID=A0A0F9HS84_9ZZZZ